MTKAETSTSVSQEWMKAFNHEIHIAEAARKSGNEGKARVCARRAAGLVAREYLTSIGIPTADQNAYELLKILATQPGVPETARSLANHFIIRVDEGFKLPAEVDLIAETRQLALALDVF